MELYIRPTPPFDLDLSAGIFSGGDERFQVYEGGTFRQAVSLGKRLALIKVRSLQTVDDPLLSVEVVPADGAPDDLGADLSSEDAKAAKSIVTRLFNLDLDLQSFYDAVKGDPILAELSVRLRGLRSPSTATEAKIPFSAARYAVDCGPMTVRFRRVTDELDTTIPFAPGTRLHRVCM